MKVAFLDRDGTIIKDYRDEDWRFATHPEFMDGSIDALINIHRKGYKIIIVTNQYLINEKIITLKAYEAFSDKFVMKLKDNNIDLLDIFFCPHARTENCDCMKPKPGLINQALAKYPDIDLDESFLVGDSMCDIELAEYFKLKCFGIHLTSNYSNFYSVTSLSDIADFI